MTSPGPGIYHPRRYYLLKAQAVDEEDSILRQVWWAKQAAVPAVALPDDFPHRAALAAARYTTWDDIDGATVCELIAAGLTRSTARAVITLRGEKMGYNMANGRFAETCPTELFPSAARAATVNGNELELGDKGDARLKLDVTAASGTTPTLDVAIQTRADAADSWRAVAAFAQKTAAGSERKCFAGLDRFVRAVATIGGTTPSFTFSVSGEAV